MTTSVTDLHVPSVAASELFEGNFRVIDCRSPAEYVDGHAPGALNLPLLGDVERSVVGTAYKHEGAARARMAALELVSPGLPDYLHTLADLAREERGKSRLAIMCWRGGERSRNVVLLLALVGVHAVMVEGGYRAYRRQVLAGLSAWCPPVPVVTLYGHTGAGKSALLRALKQLAPRIDAPRPWPVDLEEIALHRGSLLGGLNQPGERRQKDFDSLLWDELRCLRGDYIVLEGEGGKIGHIFLPQAVAHAIRMGIPVQIEADAAERARRIIREYAPQGWDDVDRERFRKSLGLIAPGLSQSVATSLREAFEEKRYEDVVRGLLEHYYDRLYERSSVEGRDFVLHLRTGPDPLADAERFARLIPPLLTERVDSHPRRKAL
jgi:tRNA 2-selenouridine synthase